MVFDFTVAALISCFIIVIVCSSTFRVRDSVSVICSVFYLKGYRAIHVRPYEYLYSRLDWILVLPQHLIRRYQVVREGNGTLRVKCPAQEQHNWPGLKHLTAQFRATVPLRTTTT